MPSSQKNCLDYGKLCSLWFIIFLWRSILLKLSQLAKVILVLLRVCKSMFLYYIYIYIYIFFFFFFSWSVIPSGVVSLHTIQSEKPWELGCFNIWPDFSLGFSYCFDCLKKFDRHLAWNLTLIVWDSSGAWIIVIMFPTFASVIISMAPLCSELFRITQ